MHYDTEEEEAAVCAAAQEKERLRRLQEVDDIVWQMSTKQGRRLMCRLLVTSGVQHNPWNASEGVTAFNCGQMQVGQIYQAEVLSLCPDEYIKMLKEQTA